jgi:hypothetical protein
MVELQGFKLIPREIVALSWNSTLNTSLETPALQLTDSYSILQQSQVLHRPWCQSCPFAGSLEPSQVCPHQHQSLVKWTYDDAFVTYFCPACPPSELVSAQFRIPHLRKMGYLLKCHLWYS